MHWGYMIQNVFLKPTITHTNTETAMLSSDPGLLLTVNPQGLGAFGARLPGTSLAI